MLNLNTHQLNVFLVAAETMNFTQAAQQLQMSQPSVSQHIQALEEHFGLPLFVRSGRNIELSEAGIALIPLARELVYLSLHLEETMSTLKGDVHGHLIVGCCTPTGRYLLPKILANFHSRYPQVRATCLVTSQASALELLESGKVHLVLASDPPFYHGYEYSKVSQEEIILITHPGHSWAGRESIFPTELQDAGFILPEESTEAFVVIREALAAKGISIYQLQTLVSLGSLEAIALSVQEGLGVGFVPELIVRRLVKDTVILVPVRGLQIVRDIYVLRNKRRPVTVSQEAFWEMIVSPESLILESTEFQSSPSDISS